MHWAYLVDIQFLRGNYEVTLEASEQAPPFTEPQLYQISQRED
jgi:hypothetical protein